MLPQLSVAPQFLPRSLRVADLAANEVTEIFPLTFGEKPALRYSPWPSPGPAGSCVGLGSLCTLGSDRGHEPTLGSSGWRGRQGPGCSVWRISDWRRVHTLTHTLHTHIHSHTYTHTFAQAFTHTLIHTRSLNPPTHSHTPYTQHTHTFTYSHSNSHTHSTHTATPTHPDTSHPHHSPTPSDLHTHTHTLKPALSSGMGWQGGWGRAGGRSLAPLRSVYLHNNQLSNAGLPPDAFRGSEAVATLSLSSNQLSYVPPSLPPSLERLHLQVPLSARPPPCPHSPQGPAPRSWGTPCHPSSQKCLWVLSSGMGSSQALSEQPCSKEHLSLTQEPPVAPYCPLPWTRSLIFSSLPRTTSSPRCPEEP